jgi:class 3 adenylate cyclase
VSEKRIAGRKLAAILAADIAGYSRLTRADEDGTIARLRTLRRELIDPAVDGHGGLIVKTTGDGVLAEFGSVVDAVRCAVVLQRGMIPRNHDVPEEKRILFRVGINLGDVIVDGGDLLGDGVNVAARLEGLASPGGICLSGAVYEQVRDKLTLPFADFGEQPLKNIDRPVHVYGLAQDAVAALPEMPIPAVERPIKDRPIEPPAPPGRSRGVRRVINWLLWWQIDDADLAYQVAHYDTLGFFRSARGLALLFILIGIAELERARWGLRHVSFIDPSVAHIGVALWVVVGVFIYLGNRWAALAAMALWTVEKLLTILPAFQGGALYRGTLVGEVIWWCGFMHVFYLAFRVEAARSTGQTFPPR